MDRTTGLSEKLFTTPILAVIIIVFWIPFWLSIKTVIVCTSKKLNISECFAVASGCPDPAVLISRYIRFAAYEIVCVQTQISWLWRSVVFLVNNGVSMSVTSFLKMEIRCLSVGKITVRDSTNCKIIILTWYAVTFKHLIPWQGTRFILLSL